jgi:hypothetical protein
MDNIEEKKVEQWNNIKNVKENTVERQVEMWNDMENREEK